MKKLPKILLEALISFFVGAGAMLLLLICYGFRYMAKMQTGHFAFAVNGLGTAVGEWTLLTTDQIQFICFIGGLILVLIDLVYSIIKALTK